MNSTTLKKNYQECENNHARIIEELTDKMKTIDKKDMKTMDNLLDIYNYTNFAFNVNKMLQLSAYIGFYMKEKKIADHNKAIEILNSKKWILPKTKEFLNKYFIRFLNGEDFTSYSISLEAYLDFMIKDKVNNSQSST